MKRRKSFVILLSCGNGIRVKGDSTPVSNLRTVVLALPESLVLGLPDTSTQVVAASVVYAPYSSQ
jgi:hypothetical protein